jgi:hypothetical protein
MLTTHHVYSTISLLHLLFLCLFSTTYGWQHWTRPQPTGIERQTPAYWAKQSVENRNRQAIFPQERHGHSTNTWRYAGTAKHEWKHKVILFGGRSNDIKDFHDPQKYAVGESNGVFNVLDGGYPFRGKKAKHVLDNCNRSTPLDERSQECAPIGDVRRALYFNDLWAYDLDCDREDDFKCDKNVEGWKLLNGGAAYGACKAREGRLGVAQVIECGYPQERYQHIAAVYGDDLFVYGGYAMFCEDYCEDMWRASLVKCKQEFETGCAEWSEAAGYDPVKPHPYKRWRSSSVLVRSRQDLPGFWFVFGGYRLWHGFRSDNFVDNRWNNYDVDCTPEEWSECRFQGGYMDDLWSMDMSVTGWRRLPPKSTTVSDPGRAWDDRFRTKNVVVWPKGRAGHVMDATRCNETEDNQNPKEKFFPEKCRIWMFGGFRVVFPFPESTSFGYLAGTIGLPTGRGDSSYPSLPYYLNDMWEYDPNSEFWREVEISSPTTPPARYLHTMVAIGNHLLMFGGYRSNEYFNDFWFFNVDTGYWNLKEEHVHAEFPTTCSPDSGLPSSLVVPSQYAMPVQYAGEMSAQGIPTLIKAHPMDQVNNTDGLFGRSFEHRFIPQKMRQSPGWDGCRDRADGKDTSVGMYREMLLYTEPISRSQHSVAYAEVQLPGIGAPERVLMLTGGIGYSDYETKSLASTPQFRTDFEMFVYKVDKCISDCNGHGDCYYGFCMCYNGYYGSDCSNITCPGDFCKYDADTHQQVCSHCCSAGKALRFDGEPYDRNFRKSPCNNGQSGENHGICDGFGSCQCAQPYIGDDCSIKDCPNNCTNHGWCSIEYPQSRCMCRRPYTGLSCEFKQCLNNCSYPNGICVEGSCVCRPVLDPYNNTRDIQGIAWHKDGIDTEGWIIANEDHPKFGTPIRSYSGNFAGIDCSYMVAFAAGQRTEISSWMKMWVVFVALYISYRQY